MAEHHNAEAIVISAKLRRNLSTYRKKKPPEFLESLGVQDSGVSDLIRAVYHLLGLRTYDPPASRKHAPGPSRTEPRPQTAGVIHTDFERGFIAAEVVHYDDLVTCGSKAGAPREHGKLRIEGKEYIVKDGDVIRFALTSSPEVPGIPLTFQNAKSRLLITSHHLMPDSDVKSTPGNQTH